MTSSRVSWSDLTLGCIEALTESHNLIESSQAAHDRHEAAIEILKALAAEMDELNHEAREAYQEDGYMIPSEVAGPHLEVYLASTKTLQDAIDDGSL